MKRKARKMGTPKRKPKNERTRTPTADLAEKPPYPLDNANIFELEQLVREPPPEERIVHFHHIVPRPGDHPRNPQERIIQINTATGETKVFKRRRHSSDRWEREHNPR